MMFENNTLEYVALSPYFDEVPQGMIVPEYDVVISDGGRRIEFKRSNAKLAGQGRLMPTRNEPLPPADEGPLGRIVGRGRIVEGAGIFQDHQGGKWPQCCPPRSEYNGEQYQYRAKDPDMIFDAEWNGRYWDCKADGYGYLRSNGEPGEYGNGSIFVHAFEGVILITHNAKLTCPPRAGNGGDDE